MKKPGWWGSEMRLTCCGWTGKRWDGVAALLEKFKAEGDLGFGRLYLKSPPQIQCTPGPLVPGFRL